MHSREPGSSGEPGLSQIGLAFCAFVIVILFFTYADPRAHIYGSLPMVMLSLCPLLWRPGKRRLARNLTRGGNI